MSYLAERLDTLLDKIPAYSWSERRWYRYGYWGCRLGVARRFL